MQRNRPVPVQRGAPGSSTGSAAPFRPTSSSQSSSSNDNPDFQFRSDPNSVHISIDTKGKSSTAANRFISKSATNQQYQSQSQEFRQQQQQQNNRLQVNQQRFNSDHNGDGYGEGGANEGDGGRMGGSRPMLRSPQSALVNRSHPHSTTSASASRYANLSSLSHSQSYDGVSRQTQLPPYRDDDAEGGGNFTHHNPLLAAARGRDEEMVNNDDDGFKHTIKPSNFNLLNLIIRFITSLSTARKLLFSLLSILLLYFLFSAARSRSRSPSPLPIYGNWWSPTHAGPDLTIFTYIPASKGSLTSAADVVAMGSLMNENNELQAKREREIQKEQVLMALESYERHTTQESILLFVDPIQPSAEVDEINSLYPMDTPVPPAVSGSSSSIMTPVVGGGFHPLCQDIASRFPKVRCLSLPPSCRSTTLETPYLSCLILTARRESLTNIIVYVDPLIHLDSQFKYVIESTANEIQEHFVVIGNVNREVNVEKVEEKKGVIEEKIMYRKQKQREGKQEQEDLAFFAFDRHILHHLTFSPEIVLHSSTALPFLLSQLLVSSHFHVVDASSVLTTTKILPPTSKSASAGGANGGSGDRVIGMTTGAGGGGDVFKDKMVVEHNMRLIEAAAGDKAHIGHSMYTDYKVVFTDKAAVSIVPGTEPTTTSGSNPMTSNSLTAPLYTLPASSCTSNCFSISPSPDHPFDLFVHRHTSAERTLLVVSVSSSNIALFHTWLCWVELIDWKHFIVLADDEEVEATLQEEGVPVYFIGRHSSSLTKHSQLATIEILIAIVKLKYSFTYVDVDTLILESPFNFVDRSSCSMMIIPSSSPSTASELMPNSTLSILKSFEVKNTAWLYVTGDAGGEELLKKVLECQSLKVEQNPAGEMSSLTCQHLHSQCLTQVMNDKNGKPISYSGSETLPASFTPRTTFQFCSPPPDRFFELDAYGAIIDSFTLTTATTKAKADQQDPPFPSLIHVGGSLTTSDENKLTALNRYQLTCEPSKFKLHEEDHHAEGEREREGESVQQSEHVKSALTRRSQYFVTTPEASSVHVPVIPQSTSTALVTTTTTPVDPALANLAAPALFHLHIHIHVLTTCQGPVLADMLVTLSNAHYDETEYIDIIFHIAPGNATELLGTPALRAWLGELSDWDKCQLVIETFQWKFGKITIEREEKPDKKKKKVIDPNANGIKVKWDDEEWFVKRDVTHEPILILHSHMLLSPYYFQYIKNLINQYYYDFMDHEEGEGEGSHGGGDTSTASLIGGSTAQEHYNCELEQKSRLFAISLLPPPYQPFIHDHFAKGAIPPNPFPSSYSGTAPAPPTPPTPSPDSPPPSPSSFASLYPHLYRSQHCTRSFVGSVLFPLQIDKYNAYRKSKEYDPAFKSCLKTQYEDKKDMNNADLKVLQKEAVIGVDSAEWYGEVWKRFALDEGMYCLYINPSDGMELVSDWHEPYSGTPPLAPTQAPGNPPALPTSIMTTLDPLMPLHFPPLTHLPLFDFHYNRVPVPDSLQSRSHLFKTIRDRANGACYFPHNEFATGMKEIEEERKKVREERRQKEIAKDVVTKKEREVKLKKEEEARKKRIEKGIKEREEAAAALAAMLAAGLAPPKAEEKE